MDFESFLPLLMFLLIAVVSSRVSGRKKRSGTRASAGRTFPKTERTAPASGGGEAPASGTAPASAGEQPPIPEKRRVLQPSVSVTGHDDSVYQGSLNAETGEGYDPCHEEQMSGMTELEQIMPVAEEAPEGGLQLSFSGNEVVRGFVMSEILTRKNART